jgi:cobalamin biosynthesis protein CobW
VVTVVDGQALAGGHVVADPAALEAQRQADPSLDHLDAIDDLFNDQLHAADLVLISRADCITDAALQTLTASLSPRCRPGTPLLPIAAGVIDPELLLSPLAPARDAATSARADHDHDSHDHGHDDSHDHDHSHVQIQSLVLTFEADWQQPQLEQALRSLLHKQTVIRLKGWYSTPAKQRLLQIQAVGPRLDCWYEGTPADDQHGRTTGQLKLVVLGFDLDQAALERTLLEQAMLPLD